MLGHVLDRQVLSLVVVHVLLLRLEAEVVPTVGQQLPFLEASDDGGLDGDFLQVHVLGNVLLQLYIEASFLSLLDYFGVLEHENGLFLLTFLHRVDLFKGAIPGAFEYA